MPSPQRRPSDEEDAHLRPPRHAPLTLVFETCLKILLFSGQFAPVAPPITSRAQDAFPQRDGRTMMRRAVVMRLAELARTEALGPSQNAKTYAVYV